MSLEDQYIKHVQDCFDRVESLESKLPIEILNMDGMTGQMTRHLYNNLLAMEDARYLEIGCWKGSSSCSSMYGNKAHIVIMDDFSGFGSPRGEFLENFNKYKGDNDAQFIDQDCFKMDINLFKNKFNIYLFDADHSRESQRKAIDYYLPVMDDIFIYVCDDWNWDTVREGTFDAISKNDLKVLWQKEIKLTQNNEHASDINWWNGIAIYILKK